jgi:hypothetical protein
MSNEKNSMKQLQKVVVVGSLFGLLSVCGLFFAPSVHAYSQVVGYWCNGTWSSYACDTYSGSYGYAQPATYVTYPYYNNNQYPMPYQHHRQYNNYYNNYNYQYPAPTCSITYSNANYNNNYNQYNSAQPITLSWSSSNASSAYISGVGTVATYGSMTVYPSNNTTYTMTVYGMNGTNRTCQTTYTRPVQYYYPPQPQPYYYQQQQQQYYYPTQYSYPSYNQYQYQY